MKYNKFILPVLLLSTAIILSSLTGCNDKPTVLGYSLIEDTISVHGITSRDTTLILESSAFYLRHPALNYASMLVGKYRNLEAISFINFGYIPDSLESLTEGDINSAVISMPLNRYIMGDSTNPLALSFKVYKVVTPWYNTTTWDTLFPTPGPTSYIDYSQPLAQFNGEIKQQDTMQTLELQFDKKIILEWFKLKNQMSNDTSLGQLIWGLAFVPDENVTAIRQFAELTTETDSNETDITVKYNDTSEVIMKAGFIKTFANAPMFDDNFFGIQGGISIWSRLSFDLSALPPSSAIHAAELELTLDKSNSYYGNYGLDSTLYLEFYYDTAKVGQESIKSYYAERVAGTDIFKVSSISSALETWNRSDNRKGILYLHAEGYDNEFKEADRLTFFGINYPDSTKRPKLKVIYSTRQELYNNK